MSASSNNVKLSSLSGMTNDELRYLRWGGWIALCTVAIAWIGWVSALTVYNRMSITRNDERMDNVQAVLQEIKSDVKQLLQRGGTP